MKRRSIGKQTATCIIWPVCFDKKRTRAQGRRVPLKLAIKSPKIADVIIAAQRLRLRMEVVDDATHPRIPWMKQGMVVVEKKGPKALLLRRMARELQKLR